jgi:protein TonB
MRAVALVITVLACMLAANSDSRSEPASLISTRPLRWLHYVEPVMPQVALDLKLEGFVEVVRTIATDGTTHDVEAWHGQPQGIFEEAALVAVRQWIYEPVTKNDQPVAQRAMVRVNFRLPEA